MDRGLEQIKKGVVRLQCPVLIRHTDPIVLPPCYQQIPEGIRNTTDFFIPNPCQECSLVSVLGQRVLNIFVVKTGNDFYAGAYFCRRNC